jgi:hypothetical protein
VTATNPFPTQLSQGNAAASATNPIPVQLSTGASPGAVSVSNPVPVNSGGTATAAVASNAATAVKASGGRLAKVLVTTTGTGSGNVPIYDNSSSATGTIIGLVPANAAAGSIYTFDMPAANGIYVGAVASGPAMTVSYA